MFKILKFKENQENEILNLMHSLRAKGNRIFFNAFLLFSMLFVQKSITSCALVISHGDMTSLMQEQVAYLTSLRIRTAFIGEEKLGWTKQ